jgi:two-component system OmpR family response regulator
MCIMLVEDDPLVHETIAEGLSLAGLDALTATSAAAALEMASMAGCAPLVVITDIDLGPGPNGLELAIMLRRRWPAVRVIYVTGRWRSLHGRPWDRYERCLLKPFDVACLIELVRELLSEDALMATLPSPSGVVAGAEAAQAPAARTPGGGRRAADPQATPPHIPLSDDGTTLDAGPERPDRCHATREARLREPSAYPGADKPEARHLRDAMYRLAPAL